MTICKKMDKRIEFIELKSKVKELKFALKHLQEVLNMDLEKPTEAMKEKAAKAKVELDDPRVLEEFRAMQIQNLEDIRRLRDGKPQLKESEMK